MNYFDVSRIVVKFVFILVKSLGCSSFPEVILSEGVDRFKDVRSSCYSYSESSGFIHDVALKLLKAIFEKHNKSFLFYYNF